MRIWVACMPSCTLTRAFGTRASTLTSLARPRHGAPDMHFHAPVFFDIPVDPDADTAREWARDELSKHEYQTGTSTNWLDRFFNWVQNLLSDVGNGVGGAWG